MTKLADLIFNTDLDLASETVEEWGVKLKVLEPTAERRAELSQRFVDAAEDGTGMKLKELYPALIVACVVDPDDDTPVFTQDDAARLLGREGRAVERLAQACIRVAGLDGEADAPFDADSPSTENGAPSTDSPST